MELWIKNQKGTSLSIAKSIYYKEICLGNGEVMNVLFSDRNQLGDYETKERALEVLNDMQEFLLKCALIKKETIFEKLIDVIPNNLAIYIMPRE